MFSLLQDVALMRGEMLYVLKGQVKEEGKGWGIIQPSSHEVLIIVVAAAAADITVIVKVVLLFRF